MQMPGFLRVPMHAKTQPFIVVSAAVQTRGIYGTDVHIAIQTVIQTVAIYGTDVQTVSI